MADPKRKSLDIDSNDVVKLEPRPFRPFKTKDEYLYAMKEDLADWFKCLYEGLEISVENFFEILETGVLLCEHANNVQNYARDYQMKNPGSKSFANVKLLSRELVQFRKNVKPKSFQSRDNVSNFIQWCRDLGIMDVLLFETEDLVLRKNEKSVILCLLEVARKGAKFGMLAPMLVQMEEEIEAEISGIEPPPQHRRQIILNDVLSLDDMVRNALSICTCPNQFPMVQVSEGKYRIGDSKTLIFVRILRNHVMVRVGGGWDTLTHYLDKHDPCRCHSQGHRPPSQPLSGAFRRLSSPVSPTAQPLTVFQSRNAATPSPQRPQSAKAPARPNELSAKQPLSDQRPRRGSDHGGLTRRFHSTGNVNVQSEIKTRQTAAPTSKRTKDTFQNSDLNTQKLRKTGSTDMLDNAKYHSRQHSANSDMDNSQTQHLERKRAMARELGERTRRSRSVGPAGIRARPTTPDPSRMKIRSSPRNEEEPVLTISRNSSGKHIMNRNNDTSNDLGNDRQRKVVKSASSNSLESHTRASEKVVRSSRSTTPQPSPRPRSTTPQPYSRPRSTTPQPFSRPPSRSPREEKEVLVINRGSSGSHSIIRRNSIDSEIEAAKTNLRKLSEPNRPIDDIRTKRTRKTSEPSRPKTPLSRQGSVERELDFEKPIRSPRTSTGSSSSSGTSNSSSVGSYRRYNPRTRPMTPEPHLYSGRSKLSPRNSYDSSPKYTNDNLDRRSSKPSNDEATRRMRQSLSAYNFGKPLTRSQEIKLAKSSLSTLVTGVGTGKRKSPRGSHSVSNSSEHQPCTNEAQKKMEDDFEEMEKLFCAYRDEERAKKSTSSMPNPNSTDRLSQTLPFDERSPHNDYHRSSLDNQLGKKVEYEIVESPRRNRSCTDLEMYGYGHQSPLLEYAGPKPRKDKVSGTPTRIPVPIRSKMNGDYNSNLMRSDSGVEINVAVDINFDDCDTRRSNGSDSGVDFKIPSSCESSTNEGELNRPPEPMHTRRVTYSLDI